MVCFNNKSSVYCICLSAVVCFNDKSSVYCICLSAVVCFHDKSSVYCVCFSAEFFFFFFFFFMINLLFIASVFQLCFVVYFHDKSSVYCVCLSAVVCFHDKSSVYCVCLSVMSPVFVYWLTPPSDAISAITICHDENLHSFTLRKNAHAIYNWANKLLYRRYLGEVG